MKPHLRLQVWRPRTIYGHPPLLWRARFRVNNQYRYTYWYRNCAPAVRNALVKISNYYARNKGIVR